MQHINKRPNYSIIYKNRDPYKQGRWSSDEDNILIMAIRTHGETNWRDISTDVVTRSSAQCLHRWNEILKPGINRTNWTSKEDDVLIKYVNKFGINHWLQAANSMATGRTGKQCRERWHNFLKPSLKKGKFAKEEDLLLFRVADKYFKDHSELLFSGGTPKWIKNCSDLLSRNPQAIKARFTALLEKYAQYTFCSSQDSNSTNFLQAFQTAFAQIKLKTKVVTGNEMDNKEISLPESDEKEISLNNQEESKGDIYRRPREARLYEHTPIPMENLIFKITKVSNRVGGKDKGRRISEDLIERSSESKNVVKCMGNEVPIAPAPGIRQISSSMHAKRNISIELPKLPGLPNLDDLLAEHRVRKAGEEAIIRTEKEGIPDKLLLEFMGAHHTPTSTAPAHTPIREANLGVHAYLFHNTIINIPISSYIYPNSPYIPVTNYELPATSSIPSTNMGSNHPYHHL